MPVWEFHLENTQWIHKLFDKEKQQRREFQVSKIEYIYLEFKKSIMVLVNKSWNKGQVKISFIYYKICYIILKCYYIWITSTGEGARETHRRMGERGKFQDTSPPPPVLWDTHTHTRTCLHSHCKTEKKKRNTEGLVRHSKITCNRKPKKQRENLHPVTNHLREYSDLTVLFLAKARNFTHSSWFTKRQNKTKKWNEVNALLYNEPHYLFWGASLIGSLPSTQWFRWY